jgi:23S rRNA (guanosine2251-2'-O)-methyltransferase
VTEEAVVGIHAVRALLERRPEQITRLWVDAARQDARIAGLVDQANRLGISLRRIARTELEKIAGAGMAHQGIVAQIVGGHGLGDADLPQLLQSVPVDALVLVLDGVQDPHNLGACMRTAEAAGAAVVVIPRDRAAPVNATVRKAACGAADIIPWVRVTNLARTLKQLKEAGFWVLGASGDGDSDLYQSDLKGRTAIVLGAEGKGLRRLTREHCDMLVNIPMVGAVESLNVSNAAAVILFEAVRQRRSGSAGSKK